MIEKVNDYCIDNNLTRDEFSKMFDCSWQFMHAVLRRKEKCPLRISNALSEVLKIKKEIVALSFGYYTSDWMFICYHDPEKAWRFIDRLLVSWGKRRKKTPPIYPAKNIR